MERFPFLFFFCTAPGVQLWFWPCLCAEVASGICSRPDRRGLKQRLIRGLLLTQDEGREGDGSHDWNAGQACGGEQRPA